MALKGIRVLEMAGLAPVPACGMILSDFGASVTVVDKVKVQKSKKNQFKLSYLQQVVHNPIDVLRAGKRVLSLNLKQPKAIEIMKKLCVSHDVLIDPYRPGELLFLTISTHY